MNHFVWKFPRLTLLTSQVLTWSYLLLISGVTYSATVDSKIRRDHSCVLQMDNTVVCWGFNQEAQAMPPSGTFLQISAGGRHSCGIRTDQTVACWGLNSDGQATPPSGTFLQISAGYWHNCGVRTDNTLACWGSNDPYWSRPNKEDPYLNEWKHIKTLGQATPPSGTFLQVSAGGRHTCGIRTDHTVACWGSHLSDPPIVVGELGRSQSVPPSGEFSQISAGLSHTCGIRPNQQVECWGGFNNGRADPPVDTFYSQIRAGFAHSCGLRTDHTITCFGGQDLPKSEVVRIPNSTCRCPIPGVGVNNSCACTTSPSYTFSQLPEMGKLHACGVKTDNTVVCWGYDPEGQTFPPQGLIAKSADPACLVYGVHNDPKHTQLFIVNINAGPFEVHARSRLDDNYHIAALDIELSNNQLYAASSEGTLYEVRNGAQALNEVGKLGFESVEALSFHLDGSLWGWAQDTGLFRVEKGKDHQLKLPGTVMTSQHKELQITDITWNTAGTILYGVENREQGNRLWAYDQSNNETKPVCEKLMSSLKGSINALETHPDNSLIFTFENQNNLAFGVINIQTCEITTQGMIATEYNQVKGIAWPDCTK